MKHSCALSLYWHNRYAYQDCGLLGYDAMYFHWRVLMFRRNLLPPPSGRIPQVHNLNIHCCYSLKSQMSTCVTGARMRGWLQWRRTWACWYGRGRWKPSAARSTVRQHTRWCYDSYEHLHDLWFTCQSRICLKPSFDCAAGQDDICWLLTVEALVQSQVVHVGFLLYSGSGAGFSRSSYHSANVPCLHVFTGRYDGLFCVHNTRGLIVTVLLQVDNKVDTCL